MARKIGKSNDGREMHFSAGVIVEHQGRYLMLDRKNPPFGFACPAGHIDEGESPEDAAKREVLEETAIKLSTVKLILEEEVPWNYCRSTTVHYWYLYKASSQSEEIILNKEEEKSIGWYAVDEIKKLNLEPVWEYWLEKVKII